MFLRVFRGFFVFLGGPRGSQGAPGGPRTGSCEGLGPARRPPGRPPGGSWEASWEASRRLLSQHSGFEAKRPVLTETGKSRKNAFFVKIALIFAGKNTQKKEDAVTGPCPFWAFSPFFRVRPLFPVKTASRPVLGRPRAGSGGSRPPPTSRPGREVVRCVISAPFMLGNL